MSAEQIEEEMIDAGKTGPRVAKGGVFAPADIPVLKRALHVYLIDCQRSNEDHPDINQIAHLLHRLNRI